VEEPEKKGALHMEMYWNSSAWISY
jgi:hypothetical protein